MARTVTGPAPGAERVFEPLVDGQPSGVLVTLRDPTEGRKRSYHRASVSRVSYGAAPEIDMARLDEARRALVVECVARVGGPYVVRGQTITTAEQLLDDGETEIVNAVVDELVTAFSLREEQKKTSAASSASTPSVEGPSIGTVVSAFASGSTGPGVAAPGSVLPKAS